MSDNKNIVQGHVITPGLMPGFVLYVMDRLCREGFSAYLVGGAVRDLLLNRAVSDWDIATSAPSGRILSIFADTRRFSLKHETVTLVHQGVHYEVTTLKGGTIEEDLGHRDFTINAMAYDPGGEVIVDLYKGKEDLKKGVIRATGAPSERFREDPLRMIRAIRIAVEMGFRIDRGTRNAVADMSDQLTEAAPERIRDEFMKILLSERPSKGLILLRKSGLLGRVVPELLEGLLMRQGQHHRYTVFRHGLEAVDRAPADPVLRLAALFHDMGKPRVRRKINGRYRFFGHAEEGAVLAEEIMRRLRFSLDMIKRVTGLIALHTIEYNSKWSDGAVRRWIRRCGPELMEDLLSLRRADILAHGVDDKMDLLVELEGRVSRLIHSSRVMHLRDLAMDGKGVMEILGLSPGPEVGEALEILMDRVSDDPELNTEEALKGLLKGMKIKARQ